MLVVLLHGCLVLSCTCICGYFALSQEFGWDDRLRNDYKFYSTYLSFNGYMYQPRRLDVFFSSFVI